MLAHMYTYICAAGIVYRSDGKILATYTFTFVQSIPFWLLWAEIEFVMYVDLFKLSINQIKSFQQIKQQALTHK